MERRARRPEPVVVNFLGHECLIRLHHYRINDRLALQLVDRRTRQSITFATVNFPDLDLKPGEVFIKDYAENEGLVRTLCEANVIEPPGPQTDHIWCPTCKLAVDVPQKFKEGAFLTRAPKELDRQMNPDITR